MVGLQDKVGSNPAPVHMFFNRNKYKYPLGVIGKDYTDSRDYMLSAVQPLGIVPDSFCLRDQMTSVQLQFWGTCTSHSADGVKEFQEKVEYGKEVKLSQRFVYYNTKVISGLWNDEGDYLRNALAALQKYGVPIEELFPDSADSNWLNYVKKQPSTTVYEAALIHKSGNYFRVNCDPDAFHSAIFQNKIPLATGMPWYSNYKVGPTGKLPLPIGDSVGGHAVVYAGYENGQEWFRNSWGPSWGCNGYFYILTEEFIRYQIWDAWIILDLPNILPKIGGWVAQKYISRFGDSFKPGDLIFPNVLSLNMRSVPMGEILKVIHPTDKAIIVADEKNGQQVGDYSWWKIQLI